MCVIMIRCLDIKYTVLIFDLKICYMKKLRKGLHIVKTHDHFSIVIIA